jgi:hypothetical protein
MSLWAAARTLLGGGVAQFELALLLQGEHTLDFRIEAPRGQFVDRVHRHPPWSAPGCRL